MDHGNVTERTGGHGAERAPTDVARLLELIEAVYATVPDDEAWLRARVPEGAGADGLRATVEVADPATGDRARYDLARLLGRTAPPDDAECAWLRSHVVRALALRAGAAVARERLRALLEAVDRVPFGLLLVDARGRPTDLSRPAAALLREADGLRLVDGVLTAAHAEDAAALAQALDLAARPRSREWRPDLVVRVRRRGVSPWLVSCAPVRGADAEHPPAGHPVCAVFVHDPSRPVQAPSALLQRALGITAGEADLVALLAAGVDLAAAADRLSIPHETARSRLKSIFRKTGCRRQIDLMRLVIAGPAGAWNGDAEAVGRAPVLAFAARRVQ